MQLYNIIILGVIISIIYFEITEISPGGIIVPGYVALYINQPDRVIATIIISLLTLLLVNFLSKFVIIYGKRRFGISVITSLILMLLFQKSISYFSLPVLFATTSIGFIIPGLIAQDMNKQGTIRTLSSMLLVSGIVKLIDIVLTNSVII